MFSIAICDENPYEADHIEGLLRKNGQVFPSQPVLKFFDPFALTSYIEKTKGQIDIILLGIAPDQESCIEAANRISELHPHIKIIFITGYIEYARIMMDAHPVYFLTKPVEAAALAKAIDVAKNALLCEPSQMVNINIRGYTIDLSIKDTLYIKSSKRFVTLHGHSGSHIIHTKLKELAIHLPPVFCHCHRDFIVNLDKVTFMDKTTFYLTGGHAVPIGLTKYGRVEREVWLYRNLKNVFIGL